MNVERFLFNQQTGKDFEDDVIEILKSKFSNIKTCSDTSLDAKEGTDFIYNQLRVDLTLNFDEKEFMPFEFTTDVPAILSQNFKIGIRHGNSHNNYTEFETPVVVIGINMDAATYKANKYQILNNVRNHAEDIIYAATDAYLDYISTEKEDRETLFSAPLKTNDRYVKPRHIGETHRKSIEFQNSIMQQKIDNELGD
jgi:hypothetical protein